MSGFDAASNLALKALRRLQSVHKPVVRRMRPGSVVVDLGADGGGNCELSRPGETVVTENGVLILAPLNLATTMPAHASLLFGRNLTNFVLAFTNWSLRMSRSSAVFFLYSSNSSITTRFARREQSLRNFHA